jgi:hypothetical protein
MPLSMTPGSSIIASPELRCRHWPSPRSEQLGAPNPPAIRFARGTHFGASRFTHLLRPAKLFAPLYGSDRCARPPRAFTSRLPTDRLPSPLLDITTTATGLLVWGLFCQGVSGGRRILFPSSVSLFDLEARFFVPTRASLTSTRAGAVKVGRRANLATFRPFQAIP